MNFKPQNLYISVIDLFSIFIPGGIASMIIYHNFSDWIDKILILNNDSVNYTWAIILLYAYILGHLINRVGSNFDEWMYDKWNKRFDQKYQKKVKTLLSVDADAEDIASTFTRAKYRIIHSGSPIIYKIEKEMADSKFFRSLLVISMCLIILYSLKCLWALVGLSFLLAIFSCWLYFKLRQKSTITTYKYIIFLESQRHKESSK